MTLQIQRHLGRIMLILLVIACGTLTLFCPGWSATLMALGDYGYNDRPQIRYRSVLARNTSSGMQTAVDVVVADPDGSVPTTLSSVTVTGPEGFQYTFTADDYLGMGEYWKTFEASPVSGEYTFHVVNSKACSATSYFYHTSGKIIPLPDSSNFRATGDDPLSPTLSWATVPDYPTNLFYRIQIYDVANDKTAVYYSGRNYNTTSLTVPAGVLSYGPSYKWRADVTDNYSSTNSNERASVASVPLVIDNTSAYFTGVAAYKVHNADDSYATGLTVMGGDPSDSVSSLQVDGPEKFHYSFDLSADCVGSPGSHTATCTHQVPGSPEDGNYTFAMTNAAGTVTSHFQLEASDVPVVDSSTCRATKSMPMPVLSWAAPATADKPLYYVVFIKNPSGSIVWQSATSSMSAVATSMTSVSVPSGYLSSSVTYQWQVVANDRRNWLSANKSYSAWQTLAIGNSTPYFSYAMVYDENDPDGHFTGLTVKVVDQNGTLPGSIASMTVEGPGLETAFLPSDYRSADQEYSKKLEGTPQEGLYTFTVMKTNGHAAVTHWYHRAAGGTIPLLNEGSFDVSGDPLAPVITWSTVAGYPHHLYYRVRIYSPTSLVLTQGPASFVAVNYGMLLPGVSYTYQIEAVDEPDSPGFHNRAVSNYLPLPQLPAPAPPGKATLVSPANAISSLKPIFTWQPAERASRYQVWVNDKTGTKISQWYTANQAGCGGGSDLCTITPSIVLAEGSGQWWVQAANSGAIGAWSKGQVFKIIPPVPGKALSTWPSGNIGNNFPNFYWYAVSSATWYRLQVNDSSGKKVDQWYTASQANCSSGTGTCWANPGQALAAGSATWQVRTWNSSGNGPWSDKMEFTVPAPVKPGQVSLISPSGSASKNWPTYYWTAQPSASSYLLHVKDKTGVKIKKLYSREEVGCASGSGTCSITPEVALTKSSATWWVQARNPNGSGPWSDSLTFSVPAAAKPGTVTSYSPSGILSTNLPTYRWYADSNSSWYQLSVYDSTGKKIEQWYSATEAHCASGTGSCYVTPGTALAKGSGKWWVRGWNPNGTGSWSTVLSFVVP